VTHELEDGVLVVAAEIALDHVLQVLELLVEDGLNVLELVTIEEGNDPGEFLVVSSSAVHRLVETLSPVVIRSGDEGLKELLQPSRHLLADRLLQRVLVLPRVRSVKGLVVPRRLVAEDLVELFLVSADLSFAGLVQGPDILLDLSRVHLRILIAIGAKKVLDSVLEVAREILDDLVPQIVARGKNQLELSIGGEGEDVNDAALVGADALDSLEETLSSSCRTAI